MVYVYDIKAIERIFNFTQGGVLSVSEVLEELTDLRDDGDIVECVDQIPVLMVHSTMTDIVTAFYNNPSVDKFYDALEDDETLSEFFENHNNFCTENDDLGVIKSAFVSDVDLISELEKLDPDKLITIGYIDKLIGYKKSSEVSDCWIGIDYQDNCHLLDIQDYIKERF